VSTRDAARGPDGRMRREDRRLQALQGAPRTSQARGRAQLRRSLAVLGEALQSRRHVSPAARSDAWPMDGRPRRSLEELSALPVSRCAKVPGTARTRPDGRAGTPWWSRTRRVRRAPAGCRARAGHRRAGQPRAARTAARPRAARTSAKSDCDASSERRRRPLPEQRRARSSAREAARPDGLCDHRPLTNVLQDDLGVGERAKAGLAHGGADLVVAAPRPRPEESREHDQGEDDDR
jgi:hypothetical protein